MTRKHVRAGNTVAPNAIEALNGFVRHLLSHKMTTQMSDVLSCNFAGVDLDGLSVYGVICGDIHSNHGWGERYSFQRQPNPPKDVMCSALWRRFVSNYELRPDGKLYLVSYTYPFSQKETEHFEERIEGDFWLVMKPHFEAERVYIPFINSAIVCDEDHWVNEPPRRSGRNSGEQADAGSWHSAGA